MTRTCAPAFVSGNRTQCSLTNTRWRASASSLRNPVSSMRRIAARPVGCSPSVAQMRIVHSFDISEPQAAHRAHSNERLDVCFNAAPIEIERGSLDGSAFATENPTCPGVFQVPVTHFGYGHAGARRVALGRRILTARDRSELLAGNVAGLLGSERAVLTKHEPPAAAFTVAILNEIGASA